MKCPNCGAEYNENVAFCTSCGTPMNAQETPAATPAKSENNLNDALDQLMDKLTPVAVKIKDFLSVKKNLMIVGGALVALLLLIIIVSAVSSANTGFTTADSTYSLSANEDDEVVILHKGKIIETSIEYTSSTYGYNSQDGKVYAFLSAGQLAYVKGGKVVEVEEEVTGFKLSADGKAILYTADEGTALYLYPIGGTATKIEDDAMFASYVISPNGKSVLYSVYDDEDGKTPVYFYNGKDSVKIASDGRALGVSDGGKYIYYSSTNDKGENIAYFYNKSKEEKTKLETLERIQFNEDLSQALIVNDEYKTYISTKGGEPVKASGKSLYIISVDDTVYVNNIIPVDNFYGKLFSSGDDVYRIEKNPDKSEKLLSKCEGLSIDNAYETIHYTDDDGELFVTKASYGEKAKDKAKQIAEEVWDFVVTSDGKLVYYRSDEDVFAMNAKGGKAKRVSSDDVTSYLTLDDKDVLYFSCDDELHSVKGKKASTVVLEEVVSRYLRGGYMYAIDEDSFYYVKGSKTEKLFDYSDLLISY